MARTMSHATADLSDLHPDAQVAEPALRDFGGLVAFHGPAVTLKVFEDNALVRELLEETGRGRVLVVDGGGSLRCALLGGNLAQLAVQNGWAGIVINGCVRDSEEIRELAVGVKALGTSPRKSEKGLHGGQRDRPVHFAGVSFETGFWVYADRDGLLVAKRRLHPEN
jgi:regulator of ribonuclease activity A